MQSIFKLISLCFRNIPTWGPFLKGPEKLSHLKSYDYRADYFDFIFNMSSGSLHTNLHFSVFKI